MDSVERFVERFVAQARQYCEFVQRLPSLPPPERLAATRLQLLELYRAGVDLPAVEPGDAEPAESRAARPRIDFGERDAYWEVYDPYEHGEPVCGLLSDDVLDIYGDVGDGLALWDAGDRDDAIWHWRFHFHIHWGDHAVDALRALHRACKEH